MEDWNICTLDLGYGYLLNMRFINMNCLGLGLDLMTMNQMFYRECLNIFITGFIRKSLYCLIFLEGKTGRSPGKLFQLVLLKHKLLQDHSHFSGNNCSQIYQQ